MLGSISAMFTGKPHVAELGYTFLFRNHDSSLGKWSTSDPLGYPDGWNNFAYCNNWTTTAIDILGTEVWIANGVRYVSSVSMANMYGIVTDDGISGVFGSSILVIWEYKIHGVCLQCNGPSCSTGECYYTYSIAQTINAYWEAPKLYATPILSGADVIAGAINLLVHALTGDYWPIVIDNITNNNEKNNVMNAVAPPVKKNNFLGKHCE